MTLEQPAEQPAIPGRLTVGEEFVPDDTASDDEALGEIVAPGQNGDKPILSDRVPARVKRGLGRTARMLAGPAMMLQGGAIAIVGYEYLANVAQSGDHVQQTIGGITTAVGMGKVLAGSLRHSGLLEELYRPKGSQPETKH